LNPEEKELTALIVERFFECHGEPLCVFPICIDKSFATNLWQDDVEKYPWADSYYDHMSSGDCVAIVLPGSNLAELLKLEVRSEMRGTIRRLQAELGVDFSPDIVHGSDPNNGRSELVAFAEIFNRDTRLS